MGITKAQAIAEVNRQLEQPDPDRAFFRRIRAIYEQQVRRIVPEIEDDICELVAEEAMADDGIVEPRESPNPGSGGASLAPWKGTGMVTGANVEVARVRRSL